MNPGVNIDSSLFHSDSRPQFQIQLIRKFQRLCHNFNTCKSFSLIRENAAVWEYCIVQKLNSTFFFFLRIALKWTVQGQHFRQHLFSCCFIGSLISSYKAVCKILIHCQCSLEWMNLLNSLWFGLILYFLKFTSHNQGIPQKLLTHFCLFTSLLLS